METEAHNLSRLRDIALPDPPGIWPPAPALSCLLALLLLPLLALACNRIRKYHRNAYRRAGLKLLQDASSIDDLQIVLKRVALAAFPRARVAPLHGPDWHDFLQATCPGVRLSELQGTATGQAIPEPLRQQATRWIRHHQNKGGNP